MGEGGSAERYTNVNELTQPTYDALSGFQNQAGAAAGNSLANFNQAIGNIPTNIQAMMVGNPAAFDLSRIGMAEGAFNTAASSYDPMQAFNQLGQVAPMLQNLTGPGSGYIENQLQQAQRSADRGVEMAAAGASGLGGLFSGAGAAAMSEAAVNPLLQAQGNIFNMANQNYMGLLQQGLGGLMQGNQFGASLGMQGAQGLAGLAGMDLNAQAQQAQLGQNAQLANQGANLQAQLANQGMLGNIANMQQGMYGTQIGAQTNALGQMTSLGQRETIYEPTWYERVGSDLVGGLMNFGGAALGGAMGNPGALMGLFSGGGGNNSFSGRGYWNGGYHGYDLTNPTPLGRRPPGMP